MRATRRWLALVLGAGMAMHAIAHHYTPVTPPADTVALIGAERGEPTSTLNDDVPTEEIHAVDAR